MPRHVAARSYFEHEKHAYAALKAIQGEGIDKCWGYFTCKFHGRELAEDREVAVMVLDYWEGIRLPKVLVSELSAEERQRFRREILGIINRLYENDIFFPRITEHIIWMSSDNKQARLRGLEHSYSPAEHGLRDEKKSQLAQKHVKRVERFLTLYGFT